MKVDEVRKRAFAMPLTSPAFPPGPYRFVDREFFIVTYRTDPAALAEVVPEPLAVAEPLVKYEFIRMPDSTGFGDYTESGQVIPVSFQGQEGGYVHAMYLDDEAPIAGGRELWGFPKKLASPSLAVEKDTLLGVLKYGRAGRGRNNGIQAQDARRGAGQDCAYCTELPAQDRASRRRHRAHLRAGPVFLRRRDGEGRVERPRRTGAVSSCTRSRSTVARPRSALRRAHRFEFTLGLGTVVHDYLS
jgi:hypothetical protein